MPSYVLEKQQNTIKFGWLKDFYSADSVITGSNISFSYPISRHYVLLITPASTQNVYYGGEYWTKLLLDRVPSRWGIKSYCTVMYPVVLYRTLYVLLYGMSLCRTTCCYKSFPIMLYHTRRAPVDALSGQRQVHGVRAHILPTTVVPFPTWNSLSTWRALLFNYSTFLSLRAYINL